MSKLDTMDVSKHHVEDIGLDEQYDELNVIVFETEEGKEFFAGASSTEQFAELFSASAAMLELILDCGEVVSKEGEKELNLKMKELAREISPETLEMALGKDLDKAEKVLG